MGRRADVVGTQFLETSVARFAWREPGAKDAPLLVFFQRFRGTMDHWDPALLDALATAHRIILFDNTGVSISTGEVSETIEGMAASAAAFIEGLGLKQADVLGWSMGGSVAQRLTLDFPHLVRRLVLAGTGPGGKTDAPQVPEKVWQVAGKPINDDDDFLYLFFAPSETSQAAGRARLEHSSLASIEKASIKASHPLLPSCGLPGSTQWMSAVRP